jgi:N-sulfoglucosamine sulfohydrolase
MESTSRTVGISMNGSRFAVIRRLGQIRKLATHIFLSTACILVLAMPLLADPPRKWNLLLITVDDMNADSVGWMGNKLNLTPNVDAFARSAHRFVNNHNICPICQPGREALLTGRVPHRSGGLGFNPIRKDVPTLVEVLKAAGYHTAAIEKIPHMAPAEKFPWDDKRQGGIGKDPSKMRAAVRDILGKAADAKKPFFLNANITDPHRPFFGAGGKNAKGDGSTSGITPLTAREVFVPSFLEDLPRVREELAQYYSSIKRLDVSFGAIMDELSAAGRQDDTLVVFWSDHGMSFPFSKATVYHNGTWSPVLVRTPGMGKPQDRAEFVSSVDVMPSLLELLHVEAPMGMDGRSWVALLNGEAQPDRDFVVTHVNTVSSGKSFAQRCVRTKTHSLQFHAWVGAGIAFRVEAMSGLTFAAMNASTDEKVKRRVKQLVVGEKLALFDLTTDPDERNNVIGQKGYAKTLADLSERLLAHMKNTNDPQTQAFEAALTQRPK